VAAALFARLAPAWQAALNAGIGAYLASDAVPIGAVVTDVAGEILSVGANDAESSPLAHAETRALRDLPRAADDTGAILFTTLEPCPMCVGAIRLARLSRAHYAARDPAAGSLDLLQADELMRDLGCESVGPDDEVMEAVIVALVTESRQRRGQLRWRAEWLAYHRHAVRVGIRLAERGARADWISRSASAAEVFDAAALILGGRTAAAG